MAKVLVVESDWRMRELLMNVLSSAGHAVDEASDVRVAVTRAREQRPDLMVVSRESSGRQLLAAGMAEPALAGSRILVVSGSSGSLEGAARLKKPFTMDELLAAIDRSLGLPERPVAAEQATSP